MAVLKKFKFVRIEGEYRTEVVVTLISGDLKDTFLLLVHSVFSHCQLEQILEDSV